MAAIVPLLPAFPAVLRRWLQADLEAYRVWVAAIGMNVRQRVAERLLRRIMEAWRCGVGVTVWLGSRAMWSRQNFGLWNDFFDHRGFWLLDFEHVTEPPRP